MLTSSSSSHLTLQMCDFYNCFHSNDLKSLSLSFPSNLCRWQLLQIFIQSKRGMLQRCLRSVSRNDWWQTLTGQLGSMVWWGKLSESPSQFFSYWRDNFWLANLMALFKMGLTWSTIGTRQRTDVSSPQLVLSVTLAAAVLFLFKFQYEGSPF